MMTHANIAPTPIITQHDTQVLFTGETGVGKSVITKDCLEMLESNSGKSTPVVPLTINFSAQTSSLRKSS